MAESCPSLISVNSITGTKLIEDGGRHCDQDIWQLSSTLKTNGDLALEIEQIAYLAEIIASVAVVVSLVYLATQIKQSNRLMELEKTKYAAEQVTSIVELVIGDASLVELTAKDRTQLSVTEKERLLLLGRRTINAIRQTWLTADKDALEKGSVQSVGTFKQMYHRPISNYGMPDVWPDFKLAMESEFVEWFDKNIVAENGEPS